MSVDGPLWTVNVRTVGGEATEYPLTGETTTFGRAEDNDIVVPLTFVSRHHGMFVKAGASVRFVQVGEANPTVRRGVALTNHPLEDGDVLVIGKGTAVPVELRVRLQNRDGVATAAEKSRAAPPPRAVPPPAQPSETAEDSQRSLVLGRDSTCDVVLPNPLVSRRHAQISWPSGHPELKDLGSSNGTFVNGRRVTTHLLQPGDLVQIATYRLKFDGAKLRVLDRGAAVSLRAAELEQTINGTTILRGISLACFPGEVTAIAGSSGAGKTTLLNALTGLRPAAKGSVSLNGLPLYANLASLRSLIGYVPQANILHRELPLKRALEYSARLRLPPDTTRDEIEMRCQSSLHVLDLWSRRDLPIGALSGGQQKRASIAVELLTEPALLFLDEPTSGLDPGLTVRVMRLLRALADSGKTIIVVSHDPDSFDFCDQVLFLASGGYLAYVGAPQNALRYFGAETYAQVYDVVDSGDPAETWAARFRTSEPARELERRLEQTEPRETRPEEGREPSEPPRIPLLHQLRQLALRYAEILVRDRRNALLLLLQAPLIALLLAILVEPNALRAVVGDPTAKADAEKVMLLMAVSAIWLGTINACREIVKEIPIWRRERLAGVEILPYIASKIVPLGFLAVIQNLLFMLVLGFRLDYPRDGLLFAGAPETFATLLFASIASVSMGLAISAWSSTEERAMTIVPLALIPQILFAGTIFDLGGAAGVLSWLFTARWTVQALGASVGVEGFPTDAGVLLAHWLVLVAMAVAYAALAAWLLIRRTNVRSGAG